MQLLNYPLLALVGAESFRRYEAAHNRRFALVVVPGCWPRRPTASAWWRPPGQVLLWAPACELALLLVVIISTAALQGRQHGALAAGLTSGRSACPAALDTSGRLVGGGRYRAVDVPPGVHAMSAQIPMSRPAG